MDRTLFPATALLLALAAPRPARAEGVLSGAPPEAALAAAAAGQADPYARNRLIAELYAARRESLTWPEVRGLLAALAPTRLSKGPGAWRQTHDALVADAFRLRTPLAPPALAVEIAAQRSNAYDRNRLILRYFSARKDSLDQADVEVLLAGLAETQRDDTGGSRRAVAERIQQTWQARR